MKLIKRFFNLLKESIQHMNQTDLRLVAAALAFTTVLSIIPFIAITLSTFKALGGLEFLYPKVEAFIIKNVAGAVGSDAIIFAKKAVRRIHKGSFGVAGGIFLVLTSIKLLSDMEVGINRMWKIKQGRGLATRLFYYWIFMIGLPFFLASYVALLSYGQLNYGKNNAIFDFLNFSFLYVLLLAIYKFVPAVKVNWKPVMVSSFFVTICLAFSKNVFSWFVKEVFAFGKLYGSVATIIVFLIWILVIWHIILIGAAFSATLQHKSRSDQLL